MHHAGRAFAGGILRMQKIAGHAAAGIGHFDDIDFDVGERGIAVKAIHRGAISVERGGVFGRAKTLAHLVILAGAQIKRGGRMAMPGRLKALRGGAHAVGDLDAGAKPGVVVLHLRVLQQPSNAIDLVDIRATPRR